MQVLFVLYANGNIHPLARLQIEIVHPLQDALGTTLVFADHQEMIQGIIVYIVLVSGVCAP